MDTQRSLIDHLFEPRSIAVIGASHDPDKIGHKIVENILNDGFSGKVYLVNPKGGEILGQKVYETLDDIDGDIDIGCIVIPARYTFEAVKQCAKKHVRVLVIITSGFSEVGNLEEEKRIVEHANKHGMRVLGPNIFGIYSSKSSLNATFGTKDINKGNVAIVTQSGALGIAMISKTKSENIGLSAVVSVGNKSDIDETDLLEYLIRDEATKVIMMYIEGIKRGDKLVNVLKRTTSRKPVIVIKSGSSKRGAIAAASHTGSLAGSDAIFSDIMKQCGVIRAKKIQDAFNWVKFLSNAPLPGGENSVIITNGGGIGVLATDACEALGVDLYDDPNVLREIFSPSVPQFGSVRNPIDLTGQATVAHYEEALKAALKSDKVHSIICLGCEAATFDIDGFIDSIRSHFDRGEFNKPMVFSFFGGTKLDEGIHFLRGHGVPIFADVYEAVSCFGCLYTHKRNLTRQPEEPVDVELDIGAVESIVSTAVEDGRYFLFSHEAQKVMRLVQIPVPRSEIAYDLEDAIRYSQEIGYPVVMKVVSRDILHKSDAGGVAVNLENDSEVMDAYQAIMHSCRTRVPNARIEGVEVTRMIEIDTETIIGAKWDQGFGPIVMFGLGGIYVEVMKDVSFRALPLDLHEATRMLKDIRSYPLLLGVRGQKKKDIGGIVDTIMKIGAIIQRCRGISDIEINPLVAYDHGKGVMAVDVRILLSNVPGR